MARIEQLDVVEALVALPGRGVAAGDRGAVVMVFTDPDLAYEVEFVNEDGSTRALVTLKPEQVRRVSE